MGRPKNKVESIPSNLIPVKDAQGNIVSYMTSPGVTHTMPVYEPPRKPLIGDQTFYFDTKPKDGSPPQRLEFQLVVVDTSMEPHVCLYVGSKTWGVGRKGGYRLDTSTGPVLERELFAGPTFLKAMREWRAQHPVQQ